MKYITYFLSFFAYVSVHILRMGYSSVKPYFQQTFELDNTFMGVLDGLVYISLSLGFFFRYLIEGSTSKTTIYLIFGTLTAVGYATIPIMGLSLQNNQGTIGDQSAFIQFVLPGLALIVFGFCQFTCWPVLLYFVNQHFSEGTLMGIWSANGDFGNICGFFLGSIILNDLMLDWQYVMIIGAILHLIMSILVFLVLKPKKIVADQLESQELLEKQKLTRMQTFLNFLKFSRQVIRTLQNKMFLITFGFLKAILYGFLLWMPTYLKHRGYSRESTYAPIIFNAFTVVGSGVLGFFYRQRKRMSKQQYFQLSGFRQCLHILHKHIVGYCLFYSCIIITGCITLFYTLPFDITEVFILNGVTGFFLGGVFNMLAANQIVAITKGEINKVEMLSTLSMVCGNLFVGIVEIVIGLALNVKTDYSKQSNLFIVLLTISGIATVIILIRSTIIYRFKRNESILLQNEIDYKDNEY